jgi:hypothetical protein
MKNLQIKITITDGEKEAKATIGLNEYQSIKEMHGISMLDEQVDILLEEINKPITPIN